MPTLYALFWFVHFTGLVTWLGPPTAAWLLVRRAARSGDDRLALWVRREAKLLYRMEHIGLLLILVGGLGLLHASGLNPLRETWLLTKLGLFLLVVLPLEIQHFRNMAKVHRALRVSPETMTDDLRAAMQREARYVEKVYLPVALAIAAVVILAIFKPGLGS